MAKKPKAEVLVVEVSGRVSQGKDGKKLQPKSVDFTDAASGLLFSAMLTKRRQYSINLPNQRSYKVSIRGRGEEAGGGGEGGHALSETTLVLRAKKSSYKFDLPL